MPCQITRHAVLAAVLLAAYRPAPAAQKRESPESSIASADTIVIENPRCRLTLGPRGRCRGLTDTKGGREIGCADNDIRVVEAVIGGKRDRANSLRFRDGRLEIGFEKHGTRLVYRVHTTPDWIRFELSSISGTRPERLTLLRLPVAITATVGRVPDLARDEKTAVCLLSGGMQARGAARPRDGWTELAVTTQDVPGPTLEGAAAALVVAPPAAIGTILQRAAAAFGLPTNTRDGVPVKRLPRTRGSYWFISLGAADVERMIDCCNRSGIRQVMVNFHALCTAPGHYPINRKNFPRGPAGVTAMVDRFHAAGILVGMHTFASKVKKTDPYVTPVPDRRFWVDRRATLAGGIDPKQTDITVAGSLARWPGSPVCTQKRWEGGVQKHREVIIDDEIVRYESIGPADTYNTFLGCTRGAWGTRAATHESGTACRHYGVDGCINGYIIDQETDLLDEVTDRLADVFNTAGFDMVYFDGGEDVDRRRFHYYVTRHQAAAMAKFTKRPIIHMGTIMTHRLWHSFARSGTVDTYRHTLGGHLTALGGATDIRRIREVTNERVVRTVAFDLAGKRERWRTVREHIDRSVRRAVAMERALMPAELGWFGIWPAGKHDDGLQLDEFEYLMVKSLAYDKPISLQTSFAKMDRHPLTPAILQIAKAYEQMRLGDAELDDATRDRLRELGKDFILVQTDGTREFIAVREVPGVAGTKDRVRAFVGGRGDGAAATVWHVSRGGTLTLAADIPDLAVRTFTGEPVAAEQTAETVRIPVDTGRTTIVAPSVTPARFRKLLATAGFEERKAARIWIQAEDCATIAGDMAKAADAGIETTGAFGDAILCTTRPRPDDTNPGSCRYTIRLPAAGLWTVWGRLKYPAGSDHSFWLVPDGKHAGGTRFVLGNCGAAGKAWHWAGSGGGSTARPPGRPISLKLAAGTFTFRVCAREGTGKPALNPRLDCLCLTDDPRYVPTDADARKTLGE